MNKVKKKKDKIKRKRVGNIRTTEKSRKKGGNVSQVVNVYVTKGGGGRRKAPAQRPTFFQSQPQLFTANYDNKLLNQIQPIQDKFIKMFNTNNDLLNKLLTKQRTSDSSIHTDTLTNDKLFTKESQTDPEQIPVFRPADTQTEPMIFNTIGTQSQPTLTRARRIQTEPTLTQARRTQTDPSLFQTTGTQSDTPLLTITEKEEGDIADLINPNRPFVRIAGEQEPLEKTKRIIKKKLRVRLQDSVDRDRPNVTSDFIEEGGVDVMSPLEELEELVGEDIKFTRQIQERLDSGTPIEQEASRRLIEAQESLGGDPIGLKADADRLVSQLSDLRNTAKRNNIKMKRGAIPKTKEAIKGQITYYLEQIAIKNRATSI